MSSSYQTDLSYLLAKSVFNSNDELQNMKNLQSAISQ